MKRKILYLANQFPYPPDSGGKVKTLGRLEVLAQEYRVDLATLVDINDRIDETRYVFGQLIYQKIPLISKRHPFKTAFRMVAGLLLGKSAVLWRFWSSDLKKRIEKLISENEYDYIIVGHLLMAQYVPDSHRVRVIYDSDNVESKLFKERMSNANWLAKSLLKTQVKKLENAEKGFLKKSKLVIALTNSDDQDFRLLYPHSKLQIVPIILPNEPRISRVSTGKAELVIGFIGTLSWYPNYQGLEWFLQNVLDSLDPNADIKLKIIGGSAERLVKSTRNAHMIVFNGRVDNIQTVYEDIDAMVVPIWQGSGMAVKALEALAAGVPIISTSFGMRGINVRDRDNVLLCNSATEFIDGINLLQNSPDFREQLGVNARRLFQQGYSLDTLGRKYIEVIEGSRFV